MTQLTSMMRRAAAALMIAAWVMAFGAAAAQDAPAPDGPAPTPAGAQPSPEGAPAKKPDLLESVGRWMDTSSDRMRAGFKDARERLEAIGSQAADTLKDAGTPGLLGGTMVIGRERCEPAPNGAPDCRAATASLCRAHGFARGRSVDVSLTNKCPKETWIAGRGATTECRTESFVTRAACQ